jgi:nitroimidazol reductase NimA-like FMN-containing flavoprotein (pyridoxamine 5'-phosphate oxidase superfamily)
MDPDADGRGVRWRRGYLADCHRLLAPGGFGRLAFTTASGLMVLQVNYVLVAGTIVLRTGTGSLIAAHGDDPVSFETDHLDETQLCGWSVLVRGQAHQPALVACSAISTVPEPA